MFVFPNPFNMATRSTITVIDQDDAFHIYRHWDGYPSAVVPDLKKSLPYAWPLPRFEAGDIAAAIVCGMKSKRGGNIYLTQDAANHWDREFHYDVLGVKNHQWIIRVTETRSLSGTLEVLYEGGLDQALKINWCD